MIKSQPEDFSLLLDIFFWWYMKRILNHLYFFIAFFLNPYVRECSWWSFLFELNPFLKEFFIWIVDITHFSNWYLNLFILYSKFELKLTIYFYS